MQVAMSLASSTSVYFLGTSYTEGWSGEDFVLERGSQIPWGLFSFGFLLKRCRDKDSSEEVCLADELRSG